MGRNRFERFFWKSVGGALTSLAALCGVASAAEGAASSASASASTAEKSEKSENDAVSRIVLWEFAVAGDRNCERTAPLLNEMRRKNYPIRRVERDASGAEFFQRYSIKTVPTFVLLVDGEEIDRCAAQDESDAVLRNQLLRLFERGREELANRSETTKRAAANSGAANAKSSGDADVAGGLISNLTGATAARSELVRGQLPGGAGSDNLAALDASFGGFSDDSAASNRVATNERTNAASVETSNAAGVGAASEPNSGRRSATFSPIDAATVRVAVDDSEVGSGAIVHFNASCGEALAVASSSLFRRSADGSGSKISVVVADAATGRTTTVSGLAVFCDVETDVALIAFNVPKGSVVRPAAFLPPTDSLRVGEIATSDVRAVDGSTAPLQHRILSFDRLPIPAFARGASRSSQPNETAGALFDYVEVSNAPENERRGSGLFVERAGRIYLAGVCVSSDASRGAGLFLPLSVVARALRVRENLAVVYRDQLAGTFDVAAGNAGNAGNFAPANAAASVDAAAFGSVDSFDGAATAKNVRAGRADVESRRIRSTNYEPKAVASDSVSNVPSNGAAAPANAAADELFEASLDALRRRRLEGAEIICVVNWDDDPNSETRRETEVLRLPKLGDSAANASAEPSAPVENENAPRAAVRASSTFPETNFLR